MDVRRSLYVSSPQITPCHSFGVCKEVRNNLLFQDEETVIFPSGSFCVSYNLRERQTKFIYSAKNSKAIQTLALSPDCRYLALSENNIVTIFELNGQMCTEKQVLQDSDNSMHKYVCLSFSANSEYLLCQAEGPAWTLLCWRWEKNELIATVRTAKQESVRQVSFNPEDDTQICIIGKTLLKMLEFTAASLRQTDSFRMDNEDILCHTWISGDCIIAGTEEGQLLMLKSRLLHRLGKPYERHAVKKNTSSSLAPVAAVTAVARYSKGFACSAGLGLVYLYEKSKESDNYRKIKAIRIPVNPYSEQPLQAIATMCISPSGETLAISTDRGQFYHVSLRLTEISEAEFKFLSHSLHSGRITGLSICASKPFIATCSKDCTVHIWNYKTMFLEQFKEFDEEPLCVSIDPNGYSVLVGFSTEVCLMNILNDDMRTVRRFPISRCTECAFNYDGNLVATINRNIIRVVSIRTLDKLELRGHRKMVQSVKWNEDDVHLVSCGTDGIVYVWNILTRNYEIKNELNCCYADVTFSPDIGKVLAVDNNNLREISRERIEFEMTSESSMNTAITMTRWGETVFVGTSAGTIKVFDYPFSNDMTWIEHQAHSGPVTKVAVTPGDQYLVTASADGCLLIWTIIDQDGRTVKMVQGLDYTEEVLCTKAYLEEKDDMIIELKSQIKWLEVEQEVKINKKDKDCNKKIDDFSLNYLQQIKALIQQVQVLNTQIIDQRGSQEKVLIQMKGKQAKELKDQGMSLSKKLLLKFEKHQEMLQTMYQMQNNFVKKLQKAEKSHLCAMDDSRQVFEIKLQELQAEIQHQLRNCINKQKRISDITECEIMELCCDYEHELKVNKEIALRVQCHRKRMERKVLTYWPMKTDIQDQGYLISRKEQDIQYLREELDDVMENINGMKMKRKEQIQITDDQNSVIDKLNEQIKNLELTLIKRKEELVRLILENKRAGEQSKQKSEKERQDYIRLVKDVEENKQMFKKINFEQIQSQRKNQETVADLKQLLKEKNKALKTARLKVRNTNILLERMKTDIHNCSRFIQEPEKLKEHLMELHKRFITESDKMIGVEAPEVIEKHGRHIEHLHKMLDSQKACHAEKSMIQKTRSDRMVKEGNFLIKQLNEQQLKHQQLRTSLKEKNIQCDDAGFPVSLEENSRSKKESKPQSSADQRLEQKNSLEKRQEPTFVLQSTACSVKCPSIDSTESAS